MDPLTMPHFTDPTTDDQFRFLIRLYFGPGDDYLSLCLRRAYLDLNRTLHGIRTSPDAFPRCSEFLRNEIALLPTVSEVVTHSWFDAWHERVCTTLRGLYSEAGYDHFHIGQAQKWVNMALKYVYVVGEMLLPGYAGLYRYCHVPIDSVILNLPDFAALRTFKGTWSRIDDYDEYLCFQQAVRAKFTGSAPLAVEFVRWQENAA